MRMILPGGLSLCTCLCVCSLPHAAQAKIVPEQLQFLALPMAASDFAIEGWIKAPDGWPKGGEVQVAFNYLDERRYYYARFTADTAQLFKVSGAKATRIGRETGVAPGRLGKDIYFAIKRHRWRIAVVCGDGLAAIAFDDEYAGGGTGTAVTGDRLSLDEVAMQEMAPILLRDDFVREGGRMADWEPVRGIWQSTGIPSAQQYANKNANAFAFAGVATDFALATAGYWFWDSYDFSASVKPESAEAVGLACCVEESDTYVLFRWTAGPGGSKQLIAVRGEEREVLAEEPGGHEPGQWYKLTVRSQWSDIQALVDGQLSLRARTAPLAQGGIGLYVEGGRASFDDVHVENYESFRDDFASDDGTAWRAESGQWRASDGVLRVTPAKRGGASARALAGRDDWKDYVFAADVKPSGTGTVGLCFGYHSKDDHYAFAWDGPSKTARMYQVQGGNVTSLAKAPLPYQPGERHRLKVATDRGYLRAYVDSKLVLDALAPEGAEGKVGLLAEGPSNAWFDDAVVWFADPAYEEPPITEQFTAEATMASWAGPLREWMYVRGQAPRLYLTKRTFYDDAELSMLLPALREDTEFGVVFCTGPEALDQATRLRLTPGATAGQVNVKLARGGTTLHEGSGAIVPESADNTLRFGRRGPHLYVVVGDALVCQVRDPGPARGIRVGLQVQNAYVRLTRTQLKATNVHDYTFSRAPTDWYQQRGTWASTDRWPCQRGWAWLAGTQ
ncbi:MAG: hypothetical protein PVH68_07025, partial [Armatimonadota bacterium]